MSPPVSTPIHTFNQSHSNLSTIPKTKELSKDPRARRDWLSTELEQLGRRIQRLQEKQTELQREKTRLEAARDASYAAVGTPAPPSRRLPGTAIFTPAPSWERQRGKPRSSPPLPQPVFTSTNRFEVLSFWPSPAPRTKQDGVLIIGDCIVRHLRVSGTKSKATVSCLPGARVLDVARRLPSALRQREDLGTVVLHVGTNDTSARRCEVLKEHYRSLLDTARKKTDARIVVSGPLPTYRQGCEAYSRLFALHSWLRVWCGTVGVDYVDHWECFRERPALYRRDGLHPSRLGSAVLSGNIEDVLRQA
ncbi:uncharacterized protein [Hoplias malabaricus]|uniref:uncharacterized protein n=1 Tax=Hoplias malabaricus TaxID=27720 RepID=UPI00346310B2